MSNRLAHARSTYLRQHADNPVDWYPWGEEAFARARAEDRPVVLSVGYAACHWCHVMAHESFEDADLAAALNRDFVAVKVDRQEHPDVDAIYQTICQMATGQGGWPLTVFLTPDRRPFYVGTYFPPRARYGRPGFADVLAALAHAWRTERDPLLQVADEWTQALRRVDAATAAALPAPAAGPDAALVAQAVQALLADLDPVDGGFAGAPKFPHTEALELLMRAGGTAADRARFALRCMIGGGIHDHVGGGFHRYSVDAGWRVPHFEKMLYDNALIPMALLSAHQQSHEPEFARAARAALDYLLRDMRDPAGGFCSAEDADSAAADGRPEEGAFYAWTPEEVRAALGDPELADLACRHFDISPEGNFEGGRSVPRLHALSLDEEPGARAVPPEARRSPPLDDAPGAEHPGRAGGGAATPVAAGDPAALVRRIRAGLLRARAARARPARDEQVLAGWNGLALAALARAGRIFGEPLYLEAAEGTAAFLRDRMAAPGGGLFRRWYAGEAGIPGGLEDYVYVAGGLIDLYEATLRPGWLAEALRLAREALSRFWDPEAAAFYLAEGGRGDLLYRPRDLGDAGTPSAEAQAVAVLLRLAPYVRDAAFRDVPAAVLERRAEAMRRGPRGVASLVAALDMAVRGTVEVVVAAPPGDGSGGGRVEQWRRRIADRYLPDLVLSAWAEALTGEAGTPPVWEGRGAVDGRATIWVCRGGACLPPAHDWAGVDAALTAR